ncbi:UV excision repair protein RAD23 homolog B isoform X1 [Hydra vulgaris]|uniref:UV excision repair protein RAD23 homolog B isoform X1 n=1 Tax=Hydra vulgaris TaxID=6087 RepID=UPI001F5E54B1|nr:UV excision repair protein RAD23 homolog B [Hydra vulgaris]
MLITLKTLQQKTFKIEVDENDKVFALKELIAKEKGSEFPIECQRLIYSGKILDDDKALCEYNIDPVKNFVVVMSVKPKVVTKDGDKSSGVGSSTPQVESTVSMETVQPSSTPLLTSTASASETTSVSTTSTAVSSQPDIGTSFLTGSALDSSINELMSLGFSREQVLRALQRSFQNADRAAEYLLSGNVPELVEDAPGDIDEESEALPADVGAEGDLNFLRDLPQFRMMRSQVQRHPDTLPQLLQEIGRSNPQLLQLISQNQEAFIALLNEPETGESSAPVSEDAFGGDAGAGGGFQIHVTTEEKAAIDRIVGMGFNEAEVIQAFFACEKNEQLAIEFLLSSI